jgi:putative transposase
VTTEPILEQDPAERLGSSATDEQLIAMLVDRARGDALKLTGEGAKPSAGHAPNRVSVVPEE